MIGWFAAGGCTDSTWLRLGEIKVETKFKGYKETKACKECKEYKKSAVGSNRLLLDAINENTASVCKENKRYKQKEATI